MKRGEIIRLLGSLIIGACLMKAWDSRTSELALPSPAGAKVPSQNPKSTVLSRELNNPPLAPKRNVTSGMRKPAQELSDEEIRNTLAMMRGGDIESCKNALASMPVGPTYEMLLREFSERYAKNDLEAAIKWLQQMPEEAHLLNAYASVGYAAAKDPELAEKLIYSIRDKGLGEKFSSSYLIGLASAADLSNLRSLLADPERFKKLNLNNQRAYYSIVYGIGHNRSMKEGLDMALHLSQIGFRGHEMEYPAIKGISNKDPEGAARFLFDHQDQKAIIAMTPAVMEAWGEKNPIQASEWLASQSESLRDSGAGGLIKAIARTEPQSAVKWALSIRDPNLRLSALKDVSYASSSEREQIRAIINTTVLNNDQKTRYLEIFK